ncbi:MAG TPA: CHAT domain-containing protein, partial [Fimbriimonadaceae bacterium]|nr:CHAT domain-containing protein [Fimbriimonadaceae bacterium]
HEAKDLPNVGREAEMFLERFPDAEVFRSLEEVQECLSGGSFDLLHVATHAKVNHANPMFSFLELEGGRLYATEIARSRLRVGLVTLSACETGTISLALKDEPDGLARSFLARSARAVLASAWPLDDEAALRTMQPYYDEVQRGISVAEALKVARSVCREWNPHPYYWAPLVLFGGYALKNNS